MIRDKLFPMVLLALGSAGLLAANEISRPADWSMFGLYCYWLLRILLQGFLFIGALLLTDFLPGLARRRVAACTVAALFSYVPFVLSIISLDIVLGLPELGWPYDPATGPTPHINEFLLELIYLFDNHVFLCMILAIPLCASFGKPVLPAQVDASADAGDTTGGDLSNEPVAPASFKVDLDLSSPFFKSLSPPFKGVILHAEAQEHYVRLIGTEETRMILYRFSDVLRELPDELGLQVHRSHWVAYDAVRCVYKTGGNTKIRTIDDEDIPVSRRFTNAVMTLLADHVEATPPKPRSVGNGTTPSG